MNTTELLRQLDFVPTATLTAAESARSDELLRSVLADREPEPAAASRPTRQRVPFATRGWVLAGSGALAIAIVATALVAGHHAYAPTDSTASAVLPAVALASWTSTPTSVAADAASVQPAERWCLDSMQSGPGASSVGAITNLDQRGAVTSMLVTRGGYVMLCIAGPDSTGFWELDGQPGDVQPTLAPTQLTVASAGGHGDGTTGFDYVEGRAGADVASISLTESGRTFTAAVSNGRWTAWWPTADPTGELTGSLTVTATDGSRSSVPAESLQK
jgi:hypothetical protein